MSCRISGPSAGRMAIIEALSFTIRLRLHQTLQDLCHSYGAGVGKFRTRHVKQPYVLYTYNKLLFHVKKTLNPSVFFVFSLHLLTSIPSFFCKDPNIFHQGHLLQLCQQLVPSINIFIQSCTWRKCLDFEVTKLRKVFPSSERVKGWKYTNKSHVRMLKTHKPKQIPSFKFAAIFT